MLVPETYAKLRQARSADLKLTHGNLHEAALNLAKYAYGGKRAHEARSHLRGMKKEKLNDILLHAHDVVTHGKQDGMALRLVFHLVHEHLVNMLPDRDKKVREIRYSIRLPFTDPRFDDIDFHQNLKEIFDVNVPLDVSCQSNFSPMMQFKYGETLTQCFVNNKGLAEFARPANKHAGDTCDCVSRLSKIHGGASGEKYIGKGIKCIVTSDFTAVNSP